METEEGIVFKTDVYILSRLQNSIIQDSDFTNIIVDLVIAAFAEELPPGGDPNRALRQVESPQGNFRGSAGFIRAFQDKSVELLEFARQERGKVVQLPISIFVHHLLGSAGFRQPVCQETTEGFEYREHDTTGAQVDGQSGHKVEDTVWPRVALQVQRIQAEQLKQWSGADGSRNIGAAFAAQETFLALTRIFIKNVKAEFIGVHIGGTDSVHVFHHQVPDGILNIGCGAFQHFYKQHVGIQGILTAGTRNIAGKFADFMWNTIIGVFHGYADHLVGLYVQVDTQEAELFIECVFRTGEQATAHFFKILDRCQAEVGQSAHYPVIITTSRVIFQAIYQFGVQTVVVIIGQWKAFDVQRRRCGKQPGRVDSGWFGQVSYGHDIAKLFGREFVVGEPHFHSGNIEQRHRHGQASHRRLKFVAVPVADKEVAVFVVFVDGFFKGLQLRATLNRETLLFGSLLAGYKRGTQVAEF